MTMTAETEQVQHTPGWTVRTSTRLAGGLPADGPMWVHDVVTADGEMVCQVDAIDARGEAVARLIAAAPDMLEALLVAEQYFLRRSTSSEAQPYKNIRAAIRKARGGE